MRQFQLLTPHVTSTLWYIFCRAYPSKYYAKACSQCWYDGWLVIEFIIHKVMVPYKKIGGMPEPIYTGCSLFIQRRFHNWSSGFMSTSTNILHDQVTAMNSWIIAIVINRASHLLAQSDATSLVPILHRSGQIIWRLGTRRWNLVVADHQIGYNNWM